MLASFAVNLVPRHVFVPCQRRQFGVKDEECAVFCADSAVMQRVQKDKELLKESDDDVMMVARQTERVCRLCFVKTSVFRA